MVTTGKPAVSLAAVPGRRQATIDMARRLEQEGFTGLYCPSLGDGLGLCEAIALSTREIPFGSSIANMYARHPYDFAQTAAFLHEVSGGRFRFGVGVSHGPTHERLRVTVGKPLDALVQEGGATNIGVGFGLADPKAAQAEARTLAIGDAHARAQAMAAAAGVKLGKVLRVTDVTFSGYPSTGYDIKAAAPASTQVPIGELNVMVTVEVAYAIA